MRTVNAVIYDAVTLEIRRIIVPDRDIEVLDGRHAGKGERTVLIPVHRGHSLEAARDAVILATGRVPP